MKNSILTKLSMLLALSLILAYLETLLPPFWPVPGMKLGLANIIVLYTLVEMGKKEALMITMLRLLSISLLLGTLLTPSFMIGFFGALFSWVGMSWARNRSLSILGISILGAATHNTGQLLAAYLLIGSTSLFNFLPFLWLASIPFGSVTGLIVLLLQKRKLPLHS